MHAASGHKTFGTVILNFSPVHIVQNLSLPGSESHLCVQGDGWEGEGRGRGMTQAALTSHPSPYCDITTGREMTACGHGID